MSRRHSIARNQDNDTEPRRPPSRLISAGSGSRRRGPRPHAAIQPAMRAGVDFRYSVDYVEYRFSGNGIDGWMQVQAVVAERTNQVTIDEGIMELPIEKVTSSEVSKRFGFYYDEAMTHAIAVERNGAARVVMLPASEYERLARLDHIAVTPEELSDEATRSLRTAQARPEAIRLNELMD